ncbi:MAG: hypothetical protein II768_04775, partial [Clostridia bacterium]|nr:hypothetical protein [Clostridia bacterium]
AEGVESRGEESFPRPLGAVIDKRPAPEASCPPAAQAKKAIDLVDSKSASVSAQDTRKYLLSCPPAAQAKKRRICKIHHPQAPARRQNKPSPTDANQKQKPVRRRISV